MVDPRAGAHDLCEAGQLHLRSIAGKSKAEELLARTGVHQWGPQRRQGLDDQHRNRHRVHARMRCPCGRI